jgi:hypothetical protein
MTNALSRVIAQRVVVISYRRSGTTYWSYPEGSRIQKKSCSPNKEYIYGKVRRVGVYKVAKLIEALCCKPEDRGFDSRRCHWNFSLT